MSLHEYKKTKQAVDSNSILNEMEKDNEATQNIGGNINIMESNEKKGVNEETKKDVVKKNVGKNWKSDDEEDEEPEVKTVIEPTQKKNIDIQVLTSPGTNFLN